MKRLAASVLYFAALSMPAAAFDDALFCSTLKPIVERANQDAPTMVDAMTRLDGMALLCSLKTMDTKKFINAPVSAMREGWQPRKQAQWNAILCKGDMWTEAVQHGWIITQTLTFLDGTRVRLQAVCP